MTARAATPVEAMVTSSFAWPNGKRIAVTVTVLLETWSDGKAAPYSIQTTSLKPGVVDHSGIAWGQYGGNEGIWRIMRILDRFGVPGTFCPNAQSARLYEKAIRQAIKSGHEVAGHGNFQDQLMVYMEAGAEQALIRQSLDLLAQVTGERAKGWCSPVLAWSENTFDFLVQEGLLWHGEAKYFSIPRKITNGNGTLIALPVSYFSDNRVLSASPLDFHDVYRETFDYLYAHEPMSMLPIAMHCHWGGRPLMAAMLQKILTHYAQFSDVWFASSTEIAQWMIEQKVDGAPYDRRFFA
jgi:peptidoglycan/xylan/chitin deacetylase (PgdA/CDA1 family)